MKTRAAVLGYRPELDGLRALAVAAVMLFHANVSWARGGFLGVDVFFVLSGFLITRLLLDERELTGRIALLRFYLRRILRLYPALVVVCLAVALYAQFWLPHDQLVRTWHDIFATATYHMNWVQALHQQPPFGLLDHAWSLSIEEQFYLIWPLVLMGAHRLGGVKGVAAVAVIGAAASAVLRVVFVHHGVPVYRIYYGLDTHADGLLLGCGLGALTVLWPGLVDALGGGLTRWLGPVALVAVVVAASRASFTSQALYQWGYVLFVAGAALVIADLYAGGLTSRLLRHQPLVAIGRISYGLYLWHWPVYLVLNGGRIHWAFVPLTVLRLAVSGLCATTSFFLVEQPFLRLKHRAEPRQLAESRCCEAARPPAGWRRRLEGQESWISPSMASTVTRSPSPYWPSSRARARRSPISRWMRRLRGRAPKAGSKPSAARASWAAWLTTSVMRRSATRWTSVASCRSTIWPRSASVSERKRTMSSIRLRNSGLKNSRGSPGRLEVMISTVLVKSTVRPWPSVSRPSSSTCSSTLNTSGWAFSISSSSTTRRAGGARPR